MLVPLPAAGRLRVQGHEYPLRIGYQTQQFLHGYFFFAVLQDGSSGAFLKDPNAAQAAEQDMVSKGGDPESIRLGWECLRAYEAVFVQAIFQNAVVALNSHWDWYVRKLGEFIRFGRHHVTTVPPLSQKQEGNLKRIGFVSITEQIAVLGVATGLTFEVSTKDLENLRELSLVRNLVLHNRSEVDDQYLSKSTCTRFPNHHLRDLSALEVNEWQKSLVGAVNETCVALAEKFVAAPPYSHSPLDSARYPF